MWAETEMCLEVGFGDSLNLALLGLNGVLDPTTAGIGNSERAMGYEKLGMIIGNR